MVSVPASAAGMCSTLITDGDAACERVYRAPLLDELISPKCTLGSLSICFFDSFAPFDLPKPASSASWRTVVVVAVVW